MRSGSDFSKTLSNSRKRSKGSFEALFNLNLTRPISTGFELGFAIGSGLMGFFAFIGIRSRKLREGTESSCPRNQAIRKKRCNHCCQEYNYRFISDFHLWKDAAYAQ
jgi:hypothetical protein